MTHPLIVTNAILWAKRSGTTPPSHPVQRDAWAHRCPVMNPLSWAGSVATLELLWLLDPARRLPRKTRPDGEV